MTLSFLKSLQKQPVLFAPMPKTASNTLLQRLHAALPSKIIFPKACGGIGHVILEEKVLAKRKYSFGGKTTIVYGHFLPLERNRAILQKHLNIESRPKVIVSVRDIFDIAISCEDHERKAYGPWWIDRSEAQFLAEMQPNHSRLWNSLFCLKFFAAWMIAHTTEKWNVKFVRFEDIIDRPAECLHQISDFLGVPIQLENLNRPLYSIKDNVNQGISGRGAELDFYSRELMINFSRTFKNIDFSLVGID